MLSKSMISGILIIALLNLMGCYSMWETRKEDLLGQQPQQQQRKRAKAFVLTNDLNRYHFEPGSYYIKNDTLYGAGKQLMGDTLSLPFKGKIPLSNVSALQVEKLDRGRTALLVLGTIALGAALVYAVFLGSFLGSFCSLPDD